MTRIITDYNRKVGLCRHIKDICVPTFIIEHFLISKQRLNNYPFVVFDWVGTWLNATRYSTRGQVNCDCDNSYGNARLRRSRGYCAVVRLCMLIQ